VNERERDKNAVRRLAILRPAEEVIGGLCAVGVSRLPVTPDCAHDDLDREPENDEISDHLPG
jgi:hypothetical protein